MHKEVYPAVMSLIRATRERLAQQQTMDLADTTCGDAIEAANVQCIEARAALNAHAPSVHSVFFVDVAGVSYTVYKEGGLWISEAVEG